VSVTGEQYGNVSQEAIRCLLSLFEKYQFLDLKLHSPEVVWDAPATSIRLRIGNRGLALTYRGFVPSFGDPEEDEQWSAHQHLEELADSIDEAVGIEQWIGSSEDRDAAFDGSRRGSRR
jgi:hypothetical protein